MKVIFNTNRDRLNHTKEKMVEHEMSGTRDSGQMKVILDILNIHKISTIRHPSTKHTDTLIVFTFVMYIRLHVTCHARNSSVLHRSSEIQERFRGLKIGANLVARAGFYRPMKSKNNFVTSHIFQSIMRNRPTSNQSNDVFASEIIWLEHLLPYSWVPSR